MKQVELKKEYIVSDKKLMAEWDWEVNQKFGIDPDSVTINSSQKVHWICEKGHKWITSVNHRHNGGTNCPYCTNRKVLTGYNDLASQRPDLMKEWNPDNKIDPSKIMYQSSEVADWICTKGHKWSVRICNRTVRKSNCPYCSNKKVLKGYNDLASQYPDLMKEWDPNNTINPEKVSSGSNKSAQWICPRGHRYTRVIYSRTKGAGCPICNKGKGTSFPEQCFYFYIKKVYPDAINRYKDIFENQMELDIFIPSIKTGIEYDGKFWHGKNSIMREKKKYKICKENGIRLFRIKEGDFTGFDNTADRTWYIPVKLDYENLNLYIYDFLKHLTFFRTDLPLINVEHDKNTILEYRTVKYKDSLAALYPEIAKEWHPVKNGKLIPESFPPGTTEEVWWLCSVCGNEWKAPIVNRTKGHGCDICATERRKVTKRDTLIRKRGSVKSELCWLDWDYETNEHTPDYYTNGSGEIVNWKCHVCGNKWKTAICDRTREYKNGCPLCSGKTVVAGRNDFATRRPDLLEEWDYEENGSIDPSTIGVGSRLYAQWICKKCGYHWKAQVYNRVNGKGCPCCSNRVVVPGINDLATTEPEAAKDWHPNMNGNLRPTDVTRGQSIKIWWKCSKCGNEWQDTINHRCSSKRGCAACRKMSKRIEVSKYNREPSK